MFVIWRHERKIEKENYRQGKLFGWPFHVVRSSLPKCFRSNFLSKESEKESENFSLSGGGMNISYRTESHLEESWSSSKFLDSELPIRSVTVEFVDAKKRELPDYFILELLGDGEIQYKVSFDKKTSLYRIVKDCDYYNIAMNVLRGVHIRACKCYPISS